MHPSFWFALVSLGLWSAVVNADLAPEHLLLVVNGDSQSSLTVANEYARLRQIPDSNLLVLSGITNVEQMPIDAFRKQILKPVLDTVQVRKLGTQIRCIAYTTDFPSAIHVEGDIAGRRLPQVLTPVASINGLTFLHPFTMSSDIRYLELNSNNYARRFGPRTSDTPWKADELKRFADAVQTLELAARPSRSDPSALAADALRPVNDPILESAVDELVQLVRIHPQSPDLLYNVGCALAQRDRTDAALDHLQRAVAAGWFDRRHAAIDPDLRSLRDRAEFRALLAAMESIPLEVGPSLGFRSDVGWQPNGSTSAASGVPRYVLSTMLGVTAGRGISVAEVITSLRRSAAADGTRPTGTVYYMKNGDIRSTTREWGFPSAVKQLQSLGVEAVIEDGVLPPQKPQVAGAMIGIADFHWKDSGSTITPGAIVEHLTSFGGVMTAGAGQTPLTEFLRHGAAGASGTVTEPYAIQAKFPNPFIHVHYARGCSLAEAFYLSVAGPYQLLIVGDPLCNPWRRDFKLIVETESPAPWQGDVTLQLHVQSRDSLSAERFECYVDGVLQSTGTELKFQLPTRSLSDGEHQLTVLAVAGDAVETVGRWTAPITIRNAATASLPQLSIGAGADHPFDEPMELELRCPGATKIAVQHLGREVGRGSGDASKVTLQPRMLGSGRVELRAIATLSDGTLLTGPVVTVTIRHPD